MGLDDHNMVCYRPRLTAEVGSVLSTLLLCQAMYWARRSGNPFYKFIEPCGHGQYRAGDSWTEELGFSRHEYLGAMARIGQRLNKKTDPDVAAYIWYWTDMSRLTYFRVNWARVNELFEKVYPENPESGFTKIRKADLRKSEKRSYESTESGYSNSSNQKLTTETTQRLSSSSGSTAEVNGIDDLRSITVIGDDDDEIVKDLIGFGLLAEEAREIRGRYDSRLIVQKLKDITDLLQGGKVKNLAAYCRKCFDADLYPEAQVKLILSQREKRAAKTANYEPSEDIMMPDATEQQRTAYLASLRGVVRDIYDKRGWDSPIVRIGLKQYIEGTQMEER